MKKLKKLVIIGAGFMGGSIAKAVKKKKLRFSVWAVARNEERACQLQRLKLFDRVTSDLKSALAGASLVVLAVPVNSILNYIKILGRFKYFSVPVTDIGSTKQQVVSLGKRYLKDNFVGAHPICGSEKKGASFSDAGIFDSAVCVVTPFRKNNAFRLVKNFWSSLGSEVKVLTACKHDKVLAYTSCLPHLLSFSFTRTVPSGFSRFSAGSFKDLTRISESEAGIWAEIFLSNSRCVNQSLKDFLKNLNKLSSFIYRNDKKGLRSFLLKVNRKHSSLSRNSKLASLR